jgi:alanyl-tRNA synthetase
VRALTFAVSDGMFPGNKAGSYVLRQIVRRAARFGRLRLGLAEPFLYRLVPAVVARYEAIYPEVRSGQATVEDLVRREEERFSDALNHGIPRLEEELEAVSEQSGGQLSASRAFYLYETFGVPIEVQVEVAAERGLKVDTLEFEQIRTKRESGTIAKDFTGHGDFGDDLLKDVPATDFTGYAVEEGEATVLALLRNAQVDADRGLVVGGELLSHASTEGDGLTVVLDTTPFYAESGGQIGDCGALVGDGVRVTVLDTHKDKNGRWLHHARVDEGELKVGDRVTARVDGERRDRIRRAHTATHLLHAALRSRLGEHVAQAGSLVEPDRLRFDFSHFSAVAPDDLEAIEWEVNGRILENQPMRIEEHAIEEARKLGALMFFGEKYGSVVRVVNVGESFEPKVSTELCGGTHVERTGDIGQCRIVAESSVGSGIRRIEALTGAAALEYEREQEARLRQVAGALRAPVAEVAERLEALQARLREAERQLAAAQQASAAGQVEQLVAAAESHDGVAVVARAMGEADVDTLKSLADDICDRLPEGVALLGTAAGGKVVVVCKAADAAVAKGVHAGNIVKAAAQAAGGGGGGRPNFAQAGGRDAAKLDEAIAAGGAALRAQRGS